VQLSNFIDNFQQGFSAWSTTYRHTSIYVWLVLHVGILVCPTIYIVLIASKQFNLAFFLYKYWVKTSAAHR